MGHSHKSGNNGWIIVLAIIGGIFLTGRILPALARILNIFLGISVAGLIALIVLVIYFSTRSKDQKSDNSQSRSAEENQAGTWSNSQNTNYRQPGDAQQGTQSQTNYGRNTNSYTGQKQTPQSPSAQEAKAIPPCDLSPEARQILNKGRDHLTELRRLVYRVQNLNVKKRGEDICIESDKILLALQQQPEDIPMVRQFFNYYLPTLGNILLKYLRLEEAGMATDHTTVKVMSCLGEIKTAMEKQHAAIFENDLLDLTVEMESLTQACKRDGLLVSEDFTIREGDREINLTI